MINKKNLARIFPYVTRTGGGIEAFLFGYGAGILIKSWDYQNLAKYLTSDGPLKDKIVVAGLVSLDAVVVAACGFAVIDGLVDVAKGTHHYFLMQTWQKLTKSEKMKLKIEDSINVQREILDYRKSEK